MLSRYPQHWKFTPVSLRFFVALSRDPIPGQASWQKWSPGCPGWWRAAYRGQPGSGWLHRDWRYSQFLVDLHARHVCTLLYNVYIYIFGTSNKHDNVMATPCLCTIQESIWRDVQKISELLQLFSNVWLPCHHQYITSSYTQHSAIRLLFHIPSLTLVIPVRISAHGIRLSSHERERDPIFAPNHSLVAKWYHRNPIDFG